jgi:hypothetical protein
LGPAIADDDVGDGTGRQRRAVKGCRVPRRAEQQVDVAIIVDDIKRVALADLADKGRGRGAEQRVARTTIAMLQIFRNQGSRCSHAAQFTTRWLRWLSRCDVGFQPAVGPLIEDRTNFVRDQVDAQCRFSAHTAARDKRKRQPVLIRLDVQLHEPCAFSAALFALSKGGGGTATHGTHAANLSQRYRATDIGRGALASIKNGCCNGHPLCRYPRVWLFLDGDVADAGGVRYHRALSHR